MVEKLYFYLQSSNLFVLWSVWFNSPFLLCVYMVLAFVSFILYFFPFLFISRPAESFYSINIQCGIISTFPQNTQCLCMLYYLQHSCTKITHDNLIPRTRLVPFLPILIIFFCYVLHLCPSSDVSACLRMSFCSAALRRCLDWAILVGFIFDRCWKHIFAYKCVTLWII